MSNRPHALYEGYSICVTETGGRYTPRVTRDGALIEHDGRSSEVWAGASCGSFDRALEVAKMAIASKRIR